MATICDLAYSSTSFVQTKAFMRRVSGKSGCLVLMWPMKAAARSESLSCSIYLLERLRRKLLVVAQGADYLYSSADRAHLYARGFQQVSVLKIDSY